VIVDVEILEVNRTRTKQYGLNLSNYSIGTIFSPEARPGASGDGGGTATPLFNLNTISQGISTSDFYLTVPQAIVRFLESDSSTKLIAKPQLRGAEGQKLTLNLGDEIPIPSTTFTPLGVGGAATNPLVSFQYRNVGINVEMTPRVTYENEIILDILVENSALGQSINIAGQSLPTFGTRKVQTRLRLREGESNLLAGLLREEDRRALQGLPGVMRLPILRQLLSDNDETVGQTDIVMLLTPRIVRTHDLTQENLNPIYIGTQQNLGLTGAPQLIAPPAEAEPPAAGAPPAPVTPRIPAGSSPIPGLTTEPPPPAPTPAPAPGVAPPPEPAEPAPPPPAAPAAAQVLLTPPGAEFQVGGGPYTVPLSIVGVSRASVVSLTVTYPPGTLRVQSVQEGSFMRQGGATVTFNQQVDPASGRVDLTLMRVGDATGATGGGLLAALLFEPLAAGTATLTLSGVATSPDGQPLALEFPPVTVTVR
jgi:general secretion pathway protein D